jgi:hypothetical protein
VVWVWKPIVDAGFGTAVSRARVLKPVVGAGFSTSTAAVSGVWVLKPVVGAGYGSSTTAAASGESGVGVETGRGRGFRHVDGVGCGC